MTMASDALTVLTVASNYTEQTLRGGTVCFSFCRSILLLESKHLMINRGSLDAKYMPEVCEMSSVTTRADQMLCTRVIN